MSNIYTNLPQEQLPFSRKTKEWRKKHLDWADNKSFLNYAPVRNSSFHKKINYDLYNGRIHMEDIKRVLNPEDIKEEDTNYNIQHYPIMNRKLDVLIGEEARRPFEYKVVVTNPNAISEVEENKKNDLFAQLQGLIEESAQNIQGQNQQGVQEENNNFNRRLDSLNDFFTYEWQDIKELRANQLLNHYVKEYNLPLMFNNGFVDALVVGEEIYQCDIRGGEPIIERVNPLKLRIFKSGYSNKIEDADIIIMEDYWSPGQIIDAYYDVLTKKDIEYIESAPDGTAATDELGRPDARNEFISRHMVDDTIVRSTDEYGMGYYFDPLSVFSTSHDDLMPFDMNGNVRVLRMYWKSRRRIKKVKSYNLETGEETYDFYSESYVIDEDMGEEEEIYYINEAWEGTKIGEKVYINMRPRVIQYNRLSNPSRCHFGIVGSIYNINEGKPFCLVDRMKPYSYFYDAVHDRLNKLIAKNWGKILTLDLAKVPKDWTIDKWLYFAKKNSLAIIDNNKETMYGKPVGAMNTASSGVIDAELGNSIQMYINLLEFISMELTEVSGISKQREGQISNRETVGGVERATLQSSLITEWLFVQHDDVKKRALECFLETAKIALKGGSLKFQYLLSDGALKVMSIDGDEFAEADYGLVMDPSNNIQDLNQKLDMLAQAGLQNQMLSFSAMLKLYNSSSLSEKTRMIEKEERTMQERQAQMQQQQQQMQQQQLEQQAQLELQKMDHETELNTADNDTKILIAQINADNNDDDGIQEPEYSQEAKDKLAESIRQFDATMALNRDKLKLEEKKLKVNADLKKAALRNKHNS